MNAKVIEVEPAGLDDLGSLQVFKPTRVCSLLDISDKTLKRMIQDGRLTTVRLGIDGKSDRVTRESLERLLEEKCTTSINSPEGNTGGHRLGMRVSGTDSHARPPAKRRPRKLRPTTTTDSSMTEY